MGPRVTTIPPLPDLPSLPDAPKRGPGRPCLYTPEIAERICAGLMDGKTLRAVCRESEDMPSEAAVRRWAMDNHEGFGPRYDRAREIGYHMMADEVMDIADDRTFDAGPDGKSNIARSRLQFDARRWLLSKCLPKVYGDRLALDATHGVTDGVAELMRQVDGRTRGIPKVDPE